MRIGYACNWVNDLQHQAQLAALRGAGAETIFEDRRALAEKFPPGLARALARITTGDGLILPALTAFADRPDMLVAVVRHLRRVGAHLVVLDPAIDTARDPLSGMEACADIAAAIKARSIAARLPPRPRRGAKGRRPHLRPDQIAYARRERDAGRKTITDLAALFSVPYLTLWRALQRTG